MAEVAADTPGAVMRGPRLGFRAALAFYPACGLKGFFDEGYLPYAPVRVLQGDADEEVSARRCTAADDATDAAGGSLAVSDDALGLSSGSPGDGMSASAADGRCAAGRRLAGGDSRRTCPLWPSCSANCWPPRSH